MACATQAAAEGAHGKLLPAPMGNVRKRKRTGGFKNRIIQDLKINQVNNLATSFERGVLPRGIDHARDMAVLQERHGRVEVLILDYEDAFMVIPLMEAERRFNCAYVEDIELDGQVQSIFIVWDVLGCGGKTNPLVYCRVGSFASRTAQALADPESTRLQLHVDDSAITTGGAPKTCQQETDLILL